MALSAHPGIVHTDLATGFFKTTGGSSLPRWVAGAAASAMERLFPLVLRT